MKAIEFETKIKGQSISIPDKVISEIKSIENKKIRVIMLIDESGEYKDEADFKTMAAEQFINGYADVDSIYDKKFGDD
jgi:hypothetical protein